MTKKVITFGVFDLLHVGHINLIKEMTQLGDVSMKLPYLCPTNLTFVPLGRSVEESLQ